MAVPYKLPLQPDIYPLLDDHSAHFHFSMVCVYYGFLSQPLVSCGLRSDYQRFQFR